MLPVKASLFLDVAMLPGFWRHSGLHQLNYMSITARASKDYMQIMAVHDIYMTVMMNMDERWKFCTDIWQKVIELDIKKEAIHRQYEKNLANITQQCISKTITFAEAKNCIHALQRNKNTWLRVVQKDYPHMTVRKQCAKWLNNYSKVPFSFVLRDQPNKRIETSPVQLFRLALQLCGGDYDTLAQEASVQLLSPQPVRIHSCMQDPFFMDNLSEDDEQAEHAAGGPYDQNETTDLGRGDRAAIQDTVAALIVAHHDAQ